MEASLTSEGTRDRTIKKALLGKGFKKRKNWEPTRMTVYSKTSAGKAPENGRFGGGTRGGVNPSAVSFFSEKREILRDPAKKKKGEVEGSSHSGGAGGPTLSSKAGDERRAVGGGKGGFTVVGRKKIKKKGHQGVGNGHNVHSKSPSTSPERRLVEEDFSSRPRSQK